MLTFAGRKMTGLLCGKTSRNTIKKVSKEISVRSVVDGTNWLICGIHRKVIIDHIRLDPEGENIAGGGLDMTSVIQIYPQMDSASIAAGERANQIMGRNAM